MKQYHYLLQHEFVDIAKHCPNKIALVVDNQSISYQKIMDDCLRLAAYFQSKNVEQGDRVWIQTGNTYLTITAFWAALFCNAVPCVIDESTHEDSAAQLIENLQPKLILKNDGDIRATIYHDLNKVGYQTEHDLAMIMHTSGSTGKPKGVMLSHRNVISAVHSIRSYLGLTEADVVLSVLPLHFDYGLYQMLLCFSLGATLVLERNALFPIKIANLIPKYNVTVLPCVPSLVRLLSVSSGHLDPYSFSSIRLVTNTGENLPLSFIEKINTLFCNAVIFSMYGLTECKRCSYVPPAMLDKKPDSIGIPMPNLQMWIQDSDGNPLPAGEEGELVIAGPSVMMGYWKDSVETNKKIRINNTGKRILLTGDKAVMDCDGYFYFKGRGDSVLKYKGAKLSCTFYNKKINAIPGVTRNHLFLHQSTLIVFVETDHNPVDADSIKLSILRLFPDFQKPDQILFFRQFPALSNGKIDKKTLESEVLSLCI